MTCSRCGPLPAPPVASLMLPQLAMVQELEPVQVTATAEPRSEGNPYLILLWLAIVAALVGIFVGGGKTR